MKASDILRLLLMGMLFASCGMPAYLPKSSDIGSNRYGAYISVEQNRLSSVAGELISVSADSLLIHSVKTRQCVYVARTELTHYSLRYAKSVNYSYVIPLGLLASISHGIFLVITAPLNLIVGAAVSISSMNAFIYDDHDISYEQLHAFARFPQGIPSDVECDSLPQAAGAE